MIYIRRQEGLYQNKVNSSLYNYRIDQFRYIKIHTWLRGLGQ